MKLGKRTQVLLIAIVAAFVGIAIGFKARRYFPMEYEYVLSVYDAAANKTSVQEILYARPRPLPEFMFGPPQTTAQPIILEKGNLPKDIHYKILYGVFSERRNNGAVNTLILASAPGSETILLCPGKDWQAVASVLYNYPYVQLGSKESMESIKCYELDAKDVPSALKYIKEITVAELANVSKPRH